MHLLKIFKVHDLRIGARVVLILYDIGDLNLVAIVATAAHELGRAVVGLDRLLDDAELLAADFERLLELLIGRRIAELVLKTACGPAELGHQLDHVRRDVNRLHAVDKGALDGLLDPPRGVGGEACAVLGIKAFDRFEQADVALLNQIEQPHAPAGVVLGDVHHQTQVAANHALAGGHVLLMDDSPGEELLLVSGQKRGVIDLLQVELKRVLNTRAGHGVPRSRTADLRPRTPRTGDQRLHFLGDPFRKTPTGLKSALPPMLRHNHNPTLVVAGIPRCCFLPAPSFLSKHPP